MGGEGGRGSRGREILVEAHPVQILAEILDRIEAAQSTTARRASAAHHPFLSSTRWRRSGLGHAQSRRPWSAAAAHQLP
jgi:tRNA C32,U32 (ribose-2'-O)-methylase TrmJ